MIRIHTSHIYTLFQGLGSKTFSSNPDLAQLKKKKPDPDPTLIRNEKKFIYFNEKKYLYYSNSSPPIRSFGFIRQFLLLQVGSGSPKITGSDRIIIPAIFSQLLL